MIGARAIWFAAKQRMQRIDPHRDGTCGRCLFGETPQRREITDPLIAHSRHGLAPQSVKLRGDPKNAGISAQCLRQKRNVRNDGKMGEYLRRRVRPDSMPPKRQGRQCDIADRHLAPVGGDGLTCLPFIGGNRERTR